MNESKSGFEEKIKELENIVSSLESGEMTLDNMLTTFEKGVVLARECAEVLDNAEKRVTILSKKSDGSVEEEVFTDSE